MDPRDEYAPAGSRVHSVSHPGARSLLQRTRFRCLLSSSAEAEQAVRCADSGRHAQDCYPGPDEEAFGDVFQGHPGSLSWTYTKGYVSQIRKNYKWNYEKTLHEASIIQTQTPISPGNSGGPLISSEGELLGVNSFKAQGENLNFAVTSLEVINFLKNIKEIGKKEAKLKEENKKIDKVVKKIDSDNDGTPDTFYYDDDGDGILDTMIKDKNQNGKPEIIGIDTNKDGRPDIIGNDKDEDGTIDAWIVDKDFDGTPDLIGIDTDGDGKPDKFNKI